MRTKALEFSTRLPRMARPLEWKRPKKWRVNVLGLGDVGGTLLTGLRLMGHGTIGEIGIFDLDVNVVEMGT